MASVALDETAIRNMALTRVFADNVRWRPVSSRTQKSHTQSPRLLCLRCAQTAAINGLDYSNDGEFLVTSSDDESIRVYNLDTGTESNLVQSKKYGADLIHFLHHSHLCVTASKNESDWDHTLRYLSLYDNRYLRYFRGHRNAVVSIAVHPMEDFFLSGSLDETVRFWDARESRCAGLLRLSGRPAVAFDPQGLVFAVGTRGCVKLYDFRTYSKGPFDTKKFAAAEQLDWASIEFAPDGETMLLSTMGEPMYLVDAYENFIIREFIGRRNESGLPLRASYSPDAAFVCSGSEDGHVGIWTARTGAVARILEGHPDPTMHARFNPKMLLLATACQSLAFWTL